MSVKWWKFYRILLVQTDLQITVEWNKILFNENLNCISNEYGKTVRKLEYESIAWLLFSFDYFVIVSLHLCCQDETPIATY